MDLIVRDDDAGSDVAREDETGLRHRQDDDALAILDDHLGNSLKRVGYDEGTTYTCLGKRMRAL